MLPKFTITYENKEHEETWMSGTVHYENYFNDYNRVRLHLICIHDDKLVLYARQSVYADYLYDVENDAYIKVSFFNEKEKRVHVYDGVISSEEKEQLFDEMKKLTS